jgi:N utilization substance protein A
VEIKAISREAGYRSKVAVTARQQGIDPVGSCVGLRGIRIQNIVNELNGEKIDVITWNPDVSTLITNALSPAQVLSVQLDDEEGVATVVVPDKKLSLAIGREGQNVRLAAKLAGWRIDIKSASEAEAERKAEVKVETEAEEEAIATEEVTAEIPAPFEEALAPLEAEEEAVKEVEEEVEPAPALDVESIIPPVLLEPAVIEEKPKLRFAEDIMRPVPAKAEPKSRKKKKGREVGEDGIKLKKRRRGPEVAIDEDYENF